MVDLSVIVVNWKVKDLLRDCLNSVYDTVKDHSFELIVIDNNSNDGCVEMMNNEFPNVTFIENSENLGHSKAMNQGIKISNGENILLLNPDVVLHKNTLDEMVLFLRTNSKVGAVGGKELRPDGSFFWECRRRKIVPWIEILSLFGGKRLRNFSRLKKFFPDEYMRDVPENQMCKVEILATACMMVKKKVFDDIGLLDETFWLMSEDVDISLRMGEVGWEIYYLPEATFLHYHGKSVNQSEKSVHMIVVAERYILLKKFFGKPTAYLYRFSVFLSSFFYLGFGILSILINPNSAIRRLKASIDMFIWTFNPYLTPK